MDTQDQGNSYERSQANLRVLDEAFTGLDEQERWTASAQLLGALANHVPPETWRRSLDAACVDVARRRIAAEAVAS
jgi:hypothetical protein